MFQSELSRQLSEFLEKRGILSREGGVITLFDLFAVYNRARGISLISPKDLLAACELFPSLRLPFRLRKFKSGLVVVQEAYRTPRFVVKCILEWLSGLEPWQSEIGVSALDASAKFGWSVAVAVEELEYAESIGAVCRDEYVAGQRFFPNLILPGAIERLP
jgi:ESCRT-II complex subunit VPS36